MIIPQTPSPACDGTEGFVFSMLPTVPLTEWADHYEEGLLRLWGEDTLRELRDRVRSSKVNAQQRSIFARIFAEYVQQIFGRLGLVRLVSSKFRPLISKLEPSPHTVEVPGQ